MTGCSKASHRQWWQRGAPRVAFLSPLVGLPRRSSCSWLLSAPPISRPWLPLRLLQVETSPQAELPHLRGDPDVGLRGMPARPGLAGSDGVQLPRPGRDAVATWGLHRRPHDLGEQRVVGPGVAQAQPRPMAGRGTRAPTRSRLQEMVSESESGGMQGLARRG